MPPTLLVHQLVGLRCRTKEGPLALVHSSWHGYTTWAQWRKPPRLTPSFWSPASSNPCSQEMEALVVNHNCSVYYNPLDRSLFALLLWPLGIGWSTSTNTKYCGYIGYNLYQLVHYDAAAAVLVWSVDETQRMWKRWAGTMANIERWFSVQLVKGFDYLCTLRLLCHCLDSKRAWKLSFCLTNKSSYWILLAMVLHTELVYFLDRALSASAAWLLTLCI